MIAEMRIHIGVVILIGAMVCGSGCKDSGTGAGSGQWEFLGFEDKFALRLVLAEPYLYVCAGSDGLWRREIYRASSDWEYVGLADTSLGRYINRGVQGVLIHPQNSNWLIVAYQPDQGSDHSVYRSLDGARTWSPADSGLEDYVNGGRYFKRVRAFMDYQTYIVGAGDGVYQTLNFGQTWSRIEVPPGTEGDVLERHPTWAEFVWLGGEGLLFDPRLTFSTNGGFTWTRIALSLFVPVDNAVYSIAFDSGDPNVAYVGMQGAIIKTTDMGRSWIVPLVTNRHGQFFRAILADPRNRDHQWAAGGPDLIETWDKGRTWRPTTTLVPETTKVFHMLYDQRRDIIYVATLDGIYSFKP